MPDPGELSPTSPSSPTPSSTPSSTPSASTFESRRAAQRSPAGPAERKPSPTNPRSERPPHWSDRGTGEGRAIAAAAARRGQTSEPPSTSAAAAPAPGEPPQQPTGQGVGPVERTSDGKYKFGEVALSEGELRDLLAHKAAADSRKLTLPQEEADYKLELPEDFVVPQGIELKLDEANPAVGLARKFAKEAGLTQEQFGKLASIYAADRIGHIQRMQTAMNAELGKLGASGTPRVTAIHTFMDAMLGPELAAPFKVSMVTERMVRGWEKLMRNFESQGTGSFSTAHREAPSSNGKIEGFDKMSFIEKRAAQTAARNRR
jgi:hypothetical protein